MERREDESHVEFARRAMDADEPDETIEWTQTMSAAWVTALADLYPDGTSVQDITRAAAMTDVMNNAVEDELEAAAGDDEIEDLTQSVEELAGAIEGLAETDD